MKNERTSTYLPLLKLLPLMAAVLALQSCGRPSRSDTEPSSVNSLQDSLRRLDKEVEDLQRHKDSLDRELRTRGPARWELTGDGHLRVAETFSDGPKSATDLIALLNRHYDGLPGFPNPVLELAGESGGTVSVRLMHGERLTRQMGSAGGAGYLAEVTFTLTSLPQVDTVHFDFTEGDHAAPGDYFRARWNGVFTVDQ